MVRMISPPLVKGICSLLGFALLNYVAVGTEDIHLLLQILGWIVAMVGVAAVMQYRVGQLEKKFDKHETSQTLWEQEHYQSLDNWKNIHSELHRKHSDILSRLEVLVTEQQRRLQWLENDKHERRLGKAAE